MRLASLNGYEADGSSSQKSNKITLKLKENNMFKKMMTGHYVSDRIAKSLQSQASQQDGQFKIRRQTLGQNIKFQNQISPL